MLRQWVRRARRAVPSPSRFGDLLIVAYRDLGATAESLRAFERQVAWLRRRREVVPLERLARGRGAWRGDRPGAAVVFEEVTGEVLARALPRLRALGVPSSLLASEGPRVPWEELKALRGDPLVEIHPAVACRDWGDGSPATALAAALAATEALEVRLGLASDIVAAPAGFLPDPGWLTALESEEAFQRYRAVLWTAPAVNPWAHLAARTRHWARWPAPTRFGAAERWAWRYPPRIARYHTEEAWRTVKEPPHAALLAPCTRLQFRAMLTVLHPFKSHHHVAAHLAHLYDANPFLPPGVPAHCALVHEGRVEAVAAAVGTPVREAGRVARAMGFSTWYRLPLVHHPRGARPVVDPYFERPFAFLNYDTSVFAWAAVKDAGWIRFPAVRFAGPVARALRRPAAGGRLEEGETTAPIAGAIRRCWEALGPRFDCAVDRTPEYWEWKFAGNPLGRHRFYAWLDGAEPVAACALGWENERVLVADLVYAPDRAGLARELEAFLAAALRRAMQVEPARVVIAETNQPPVEAALRGLGLRPVRQAILDWRPSAGAALGPDATCYRSLIDADFGVRPSL